MQPKDYDAFSAIITAICDCYQRKPLTASAMKLYFSVLSSLTIAEISKAVEAHIQDAEQGKFFPTPSHLIAKAVPPKMTPEQLIDEAIAPKTPIGVMARMEIGSFDLRTKSYTFLRPIAMKCLRLVPQWQARIDQNELTPFELQTLGKYEVALPDNQKRLHHQSV